MHLSLSMTSCIYRNGLSIMSANSQMQWRLSAEEQTMTYAELNEQANRLARHLQKMEPNIKRSSPF